MLAWERWLGPWFEARALAARQAARAEGRADDFDEATNLDDLWRLRAALNGGATSADAGAANGIGSAVMISGKQVPQLEAPSGRDAPADGKQQR
jgi:hypothetical protein